MIEIVAGPRPPRYDEVFWEELSKHPETKVLFEASGYDWERLPPPHKEICIGCHNKAMRDGFWHDDV